MQTQTEKPNHEAQPQGTTYHVHINKKLYVLHEPVLTGEQLKKLAGIPLENQLFIEHGGRDTPIGDQQGVAMENGQHFYDVAPGTFGKE
jgi:hypothetical protein